MEAGRGGELRVRLGGGRPSQRLGGGLPVFPPGQRNAPPVICIERQFRRRVFGGQSIQRGDGRGIVAALAMKLGELHQRVVRQRRVGPADQRLIVPYGFVKCARQLLRPPQPESALIRLRRLAQPRQRLGVVLHRLLGRFRSQEQIA